MKRESVYSIFLVIVIIISSTLVVSNRMSHDTRYTTGSKDLPPLYPPECTSFIITLQNPFILTFDISFEYSYFFQAAVITLFQDSIPIDAYVITFDAGIDRLIGDFFLNPFLYFASNFVVQCELYTSSYGVITLTSPPIVCVSIAYLIICIASISIAVILLLRYYKKSRTRTPQHIMIIIR